MVKWPENQQVGTNIGLDSALNVSGDKRLSLWRQFAVCWFWVILAGVLPGVTFIHVFNKWTLNTYHFLDSWLGTGDVRVIKPDMVLTLPEITVWNQHLCQVEKERWIFLSTVSIFLSSEKFALGFWKDLAKTLNSSWNTQDVAVHSDLHYFDVFVDFVCI